MYLIYFPPKHGEKSENRVFLAGFPVKSPHNPRERFSKLKPDTVKETQELHASCMLRKRIFYRSVVDPTPTRFTNPRSVILSSFTCRTGSAVKEARNACNFSKRVCSWFCHYCCSPDVRDNVLPAGSPC